MKFLLALFISLFLVDCANTGLSRNSSPGKRRLKIERPGMGAALDEKIATLVLENKHAKAKKLCNDVLFASRSNQDRETANYWRTLLIVNEEMEAGNYKKSIDLMKKGAKWWDSRAKDYHIKVLKNLMEELRKQEKLQGNLRQKIQSLNRNAKSNAGAARANRLAKENQKLREDLASLKAVNAKLTQLLIDLEKQ